MLTMPNKVTIEIPLCDRCKQVGYCLAKYENSPSNRKKRQLTEKEISAMVPIRTTFRDRSTRFGNKLQQAHDLFHQDEFEQASYMYRDMLETRNDCDEILIGLAASFFFMKQYEAAADIGIKMSNYRMNEFSNSFVSLCELKIKEQEKENQSGQINISSEIFRKSKSKTSIA